MRTAAAPVSHTRRMHHRRSLWVVFAVGLAVALGGAAVRLAERGAADQVPDRVAALRADGSSRVVAPSPPQEGEQQASFGVIHQTRFPSPEGEIYAVLWFDVPPGSVTGATDAQLVDAWTTNVLGNLGGEIDEEDVLEDGPYRGVGLHVAKGEHDVPAPGVRRPRPGLRGRSLVATGAVDGVTAERFVDSREILVP